MRRRECGILLYGECKGDTVPPVCCWPGAVVGSAVREGSARSRAVSEGESRDHSSRMGARQSGPVTARCARQPLGNEAVSGGNMWRGGCPARDGAMVEGRDG